MYWCVCVCVRAGVCVYVFRCVDTNAIVVVTIVCASVYTAVYYGVCSVMLSIACTNEWCNATVVYYCAFRYVLLCLLVCLQICAVLYSLSSAMVYVLLC